MVNLASDAAYTGQLFATRAEKGDFTPRGCGRDGILLGMTFHSVFLEGGIVDGMDTGRGKYPGLLACLFVMCLWGCSKTKEQGSSVEALLPAAYTDTTLEFPKLRFTNATVSLNDRCPVRKAKLNQRLAPLFVNGRPIGFC